MQLPPYPKQKRGNCGKNVRQCKIRLLGPLAQLGHKEARYLGFDVGRALWESVSRENDRYVAGACVDKRGGGGNTAGERRLRQNGKKLVTKGRAGVE